MANFYSIITNRGKELEAEALASGTKITLAKFVVGDGNGQAVAPKPTQTKLINEQYRGDIGELSVSPDQPTQMMAKVVLPTEVGGFTVREIGMLTDAGELYAVANCAAIEKPVGGVSVNMQFRLAVSDTANITLNVATGDGLFLRIDQDLTEIRGRGAQAQKTARESLAIVDASTKQRGLVQLNSATNSTSEIQAATPAAVKAANDNANTRLEKNKNLSDLSDKLLARKNLALGTAATSNVQKSITDNTPNALMINGAWGGASGVGMVDSDILSPTSIGNTFFNQGGGAANSHFGGYGTGIHLSYGSNGDNKQRLTANLFVDSAGNLSVEWLAVNKSDGAIVVKRIQKLYGPLNKPSASDIRAFPDNGILPTGTNLNTLTGTKQGFYFQSTNSNATTALNYPVNSAGSLCVMRNGANGNDGCTQEYRPYNSSVVFSRIYDVASNKWSAWDYIYSKNNPPSASAVGALPIGGGTLNGNLTVKNTLQVGGVGNAAINIGDNDSGLRSSVDGQVDLYANGRMYGYWNTTTLGFAGQMIPSNYNNFDARYINNLQMGAEEYKDIPYPGQASIPLGACITAIVGTTKPTGGGVGFYISRIYFRRIQKYIAGSWKNIA
ncbi:phage tail fiber protein [Hafnia paralvei ATCC 29927]|uniref:phage tail-collar fiber domain-containing protein n=1 Tax=Hafnia paralvei TaxID=546367 RepID=UPI0007F4238F|nr:phage tail protein [Hafnia paralvei]MDU1193767.1 phage tail protein [Enterobacteriaceae bacterium]MDU1245870.1 phage tail protein [Enterobacteriaceae bacterium]OAT42871.1 phage tail fiber protein [Hafnia paralvei ATCC 29927]